MYYTSSVGSQLSARISKSKERYVESNGIGKERSFW
jgi:hypothetical protein